MESPYLRSSLEATAHGVIEPQLEVEQTVDRLSDLLDGARDHEPRGRAWDLLALVEALRRVRPELVREVEGEDVLARAEAEIERAPRDLATSARVLPEPGSWLEAGRSFDASFDDPGLEPEQERELACNLLVDLDEAELVLCAAQRAGIDDAGLADGLASCRAWFREHADRFLAASVLAQAIAAGFRPDLEAFDVRLAGTATKFVALLEAAERAERELRLEDVPAIDPGAVEQVRRKRRDVPPPDEREANGPARRDADASAADRGGADDVVSRIGSRRGARLAADAGEDGALRGHRVWREPDTGRLARLVVPAHAVAGDDTELSLTLHEADGEATDAFDGRIAEIDGVAVAIRGHAARFRLGDLAASEAPALRVDGVAWQRAEE